MPYHERRTAEEILRLNVTPRELLTILDMIEKYKPGSVKNYQERKAEAELEVQIHRFSELPVTEPINIDLDQLHIHVVAVAREINRQSEEPIEAEYLLRQVSDLLGRFRRYKIYTDLWGEERHVISEEVVRAIVEEVDHHKLLKRFRKMGFPNLGIGPKNILLVKIALYNHRHQLSPGTL